jgi:hypothetical protein
MKYTKCVSRREERRGAYRVLVVKSMGNKSRGRPRRRWEENIKIKRSPRNEKGT